MTNARTIAFVHHKGGTGKTTACLNVAGWLAKLGKKVLVVDLDPQGNATGGLGIDRKSVDESIHNVLFGKTPLEEIILETESGVMLAPSSIELLVAETNWDKGIFDALRLQERLVGVAKYFDYILVDVPPGSTLLMMNGIVGCDNLVIPIDSGIFAFETMETLKTLVVELQRKLGIQPNILMVLLRKYGFSNGGPTENIEKLVRVFLTRNNMPGVKIIRIPFSEDIYTSQIKGSPISHFLPESDVGRAYEEIAKEFVQGAV